MFAVMKQVFDCEHCIKYKSRNPISNFDEMTSARATKPRTRFWNMRKARYETRCNNNRMSTKIMSYRPLCYSDCLMYMQTCSLLWISIYCMPYALLYYETTIRARLKIMSPEEKTKPKRLHSQSRTMKDEILCALHSLSSTLFTRLFFALYWLNINRQTIRAS